MNRTANQAQNDAKSAYAKELEIMRAKIAGLQTQLDRLVGDGTLSDKIDWSDVGDLQHLNSILGEALDVHPTRVK